nr:MAG TPA: hypothetical protein [Crassvirales sp.]
MLVIVLGVFRILELLKLSIIQLILILLIIIEFRLGICLRSPNFMCISRLINHNRCPTRFVCAHSGIYVGV